MNKILVVGSINMDIVVGTQRLPSSGESVKGTYLKYIPGGKGANQAIAASRLGADVFFVGKLGNDSFGGDLKRFLNSERLNTEGVSQIQTTSGIALITVGEKGENSIIVVPGSNAEVTKDYVDGYEYLIKQSDIIVSQFEIPIESVERVFTLAKKHSKTTVLNPAPAQEVTNDLFKFVDYLILNETELSFFVGKLGGLTQKDEIIQAAKELISRGLKTVIVTLGSNGAITITRNEILVTKGIKVKAVDTTSAGDCFLGALVTRLNTSSSLEEALNFANKAASISVQKFGSSISIPHLRELEVDSAIPVQSATLSYGEELENPVVTI